MVSSSGKVFVALSGGVDSSTTAALLCQKGFDCAGVFMITSDEACRAQEDAEKVAKKLGMKFYVLDLRRNFERILDYFCSEYKQGRTPNPCIFCNRYIKFGRLWDFARGNGADFLATGHYARILDTRNWLDGYQLSITSYQSPAISVGLYEAADVAKDQSYALSMIDKAILPYVILPMGEYSKARIKEMAAEFGLGIERKKESQEICFIPNNDYVAVLEERCPELVRSGDIVDSSGKILGRHNGVHRFTIGQRRGLRVAMGRPYYVVKIDAQTNTVTLGPKEEVMHRRLTATAVNWLTDRPQSRFRAKVKIRYNDEGASAMVSPQDSSIAVEFDEPISAITPGQLAVLYVQEAGNNRVVGGGWIDKVSD